MGYHLLDKPNPNGPFFYTSRRTCQHGIPANQLPHIVVVHTADSEPDISGADTGAEGVANYGSTTTRPVSWHETIDSDSRIPMLPDSYVAFHVRGYNTCSVGGEIATRAHRWADLPDAWKAAVYRNTADWIDEKCRAHNIPKTLLTRSQVDAGARGVIGHDLLDPTRRTDPGAAFDWAAVLEEDDMTDDLKRDDSGPRVAFWRARLRWWNFAPLGEDKLPLGDQFDSDMQYAVQQFQKRVGLPVSGVINEETRTLLIFEGSTIEAIKRISAHDAKPHGGSSSDVANLTASLSELRTAYNDHGHGKTNKPDS